MLSIGVYAWMGPLIPDVRTTATMALFAVAVMLPATIFIGATLPLSVRVLGDDNGLLESSDYLASYIGGYLENAASRYYRLSLEELARTRRNVTIIAARLGDSLDVADPHRLTSVQDAVNALVEYLDAYPEEAESKPEGSYRFPGPQPLASASSTLQRAPRRPRDRNAHSNPVTRWHPPMEPVRFP